MRILVLGAGATGGYFGGRLAQSGADVTFLVRPARAEKLAQNGLVIQAPDGDSRIQVKTVQAGSLKGTYDLVILGCKAYDLDSAIAAITPAVGPHTTVLPILNGLNHYRALDAAFGADRVMAGLTHVVATLGPNGEIMRSGPQHRLTFGERNGTISPRMKAFAELCAKAAMESLASPDVMQDAWEKYSFLATAAGMTCLMRANIGIICATDEGEAITREMYAECTATAKAAGYAPRPASQESSLKTLTEKGSTVTASMMRDLEAGYRTEASHILRDMLERGRTAGLPMSLMRVAWCHMQAHTIRSGH